MEHLLERLLGARFQTAKQELAAKGHDDPSVPDVLGRLARDAYESLAGRVDDETAESIAAPSDDGDRFSQAMVRALIAAAKCDGVIDSAEERRIMTLLEQSGAGADAHAFVEREMAAPLDVDAVIRDVTTREEAAQIYAASLMAIDIDKPSEQAYLALLAARLKLPEPLVAAMHERVHQPAPLTPDFPQPKS